MTLKINRVLDSHKDYVCTKFGQNPLKDVDSRVFIRHSILVNTPSMDFDQTWYILRPEENLEPY
jgi:hypothetical protein